MSDRVPCAGGDRPALTAAERAYVQMLKVTRERTRDVAGAMAAVKTARIERDSAIALHGPAHFLTELSRERLRKARASAMALSAEVDRLESALDEALSVWAVEDAARQYMKHQPSHDGAASFDGHRPPEAGPPWHEAP